MNKARKKFLEKSSLNAAYHYIYPYHIISQKRIIFFPKLHAGFLILMNKARKKFLKKSSLNAAYHYIYPYHIMSH